MLFYNRESNIDFNTKTKERVVSYSQSSSWLDAFYELSTYQSILHLLTKSGQPFICLQIIPFFNPGNQTTLLIKLHNPNPSTTPEIIYFVRNHTFTTINSMQYPSPVPTHKEKTHIHFKLLIISTHSILYWRWRESLQWSSWWFWRWFPWWRRQGRPFHVATCRALSTLVWLTWLEAANQVNLAAAA